MKRRKFLKGIVGVSVLSACPMAVVAYPPTRVVFSAENWMTINEVCVSWDFPPNPHEDDVPLVPTYLAALQRR